VIESGPPASDPQVISANPTNVAFPEVLAFACVGARPSRMPEPSSATSGSRLRDAQLLDQGFGSEGTNGASSGQLDACGPVHRITERGDLQAIIGTDLAMSKILPARADAARAVALRLPGCLQRLGTLAVTW
jgi:hypothetical protein